MPLLNDKKLLDYSISASWHVFINKMYILCTVLHVQHECAEHVRINKLRRAHHGYVQRRGTQEECTKHDIFSTVL
jgi:hypothetical protein